MRRFTTLTLAVLLVAACSPDEASEETSTTSTSLPASTTTTMAPTTTSSMVDTTTSLPPTTTTTIATTTTTAQPATVELSDEGIQAGDVWVPFGTDDDDTVSAVAAVLGDPFEDTGWLDSATDGWEKFGVCPSPNVRGVSWGSGGTVSLQLLFTDADTDFWLGGVEHFFTFYYGGASDPEGLMTTKGVGIGSTLGELQAAYDPAKTEITEAFFDPSLGFWSYDYAPWTGLWGFATGQGDDDTITSINGGRGCGE